MGGLGDVVTSLSRAVQDLNHHVDVVLPKYDCLNLNHVSNFPIFLCLLLPNQNRLYFEALLISVYNFFFLKSSDLYVLDCELLSMI